MTTAALYARVSSERQVEANTPQARIDAKKWQHSTNVI